MDPGRRLAPRCFWCRAIESPRSGSVALATTILDLAVSVWAGAAFDRSHAGTMQFVERMPWIPTIGITYHLGVDGLSLPLVILTTLLTVLCVIYSWRVELRPQEYMILFLLLETRHDRRVPVPRPLPVLRVLGGQPDADVSSSSAIWGGPRRIYAAIKFFLYTLVGSLAMLLSILIVYFHVVPRTFDMPALVGQQPLAGDLPLAVLAFWGFFPAFAIKVPMFPFHTWLPDAHVEAPTAGSVLLAGVLLKLGTYGFVRIALPLLPRGVSPDGADRGRAGGDRRRVRGAGGDGADGPQEPDRVLSVDHLGYVMLGVAAAAAAGTDAHVRGGDDRR